MGYNYLIINKKDYSSIDYEFSKKELEKLK